MLGHDTRAAILRLRQEGHGTRFIAHAVGVSRVSVKKVLSEGHPEVPSLVRPGALDDHEEAVRVLELACAGNLVRVHEELQARHGVQVPYSTLTRFCRDKKIGEVPPKVAGRYHFEPGQEMQHDTSPHRVLLGGQSVVLQCALLVMCFSRRKFMQIYPRWDRFHARVFFTAALQYFGGSAGTCMVDNSAVVLAGGSGRDAVVSPEMVSFSKHFGFHFVAHAIGDANRSGRVERPFHHIERNFYPGRTFTELSDLNGQAVTWCDTVNGRYHEGCKDIPDHLFAIERPHLRPLPAFIPEPSVVHGRKVDVEGFVSLHTNRYSAPEELIGVDVEVHEHFDRVVLFHRHRRLCEHQKKPHGADQRVIAPEHTRRWARLHTASPSAEEQALRSIGPAMATLCDRLRVRYGGQALKAMRRLRRIWMDYPDDIVLRVITRSVEHDLTDLGRIEEMVLRSIHGDYFRLTPPSLRDDHG